MRGNIHSGKRPSIRSLVALTIGVALAIFMAAFAYIFFSNMLKMLYRSEDEQIRTKSGIVTSSVNASMAASRAFSRDWASWDETYEFAIGINPEHFSKYWTEDWKIQGQQYNFLYVKDLSGNDLYFKYYDYFNNEGSTPPEGFSGFLSGLEEYMLQYYAQRGYGRDGVVFYGGVPYYVCARPILTYDEKSEPAGALFFGRVFDERELIRITGSHDLSFKVKQDDSYDQTDAPIFRTGGAITLSTPIKGFYDNENIILEITGSRDLYREGLSIILISSLALAAVTACFVFAIFRLLQKNVLRYIEQISRDVKSVAESSQSIDVGRYGGSREFHTLAGSINEMLLSLNESRENAMRSTISRQTLINLLNGMSIYLFVSDIETYKVLFINDKMKEHFNVNDDVIGKPCSYVVQQCGMQECEYCPKKELTKNPGKTIVMETYDNDRGRYYKQYNIIIDWVGANNAHLQYLIDITEIKEAELNLKRRLEQEELMSAISSSFINDDDITAFMNKALEMTGKFMNVCRISIAQYDEKEKSFQLNYTWNGEINPVYLEIGAKMKIRENTPMYEALIIKDAGYFTVSDTDVGILYNHVKRLNAKSFMMISIYVSGSFWGILEFDHCGKAYSWTESDIYLGRLIGNVFSGVLTRRNAEIQLKRMEALVNSARKTAITYVKKDGSFEFFNPAACEISGYSPEELIRGGIHILYDEETLKYINNEIIPIIHENGEYEFEVPVICKNGEARIINYLGFEIGNDSEDRGYIGMDVTEKRKLEKELIEAKESAENASLAKSEFLSRMSHEIRTPMNAIIGMTRIGRASDDPEKKEYCLEKIDNSSKHLLGIINDILDLSKIEANKFELSQSEFNIERMIGNITSMLSFRSDDKQQKFTTDIAHNIPSSVLGDEMRLSQIIMNLLSNAAKFTPEKGSITLGVKKINETGDICTLQFEVTDNGIGISPEQQERLFTSFEQADKGISRKYGGTGLGLAISKKIVELMGGEIWVKSELGKGSKFVFTVKAGKGVAGGKYAGESEFSGKAEDLPEKVNLENHDVLIVEDIEINREIIASLLEGTGAAIDFAVNGSEAYEMFRENPDKYSVILMDVHMPVMDGCEATRKIRSLDFKKARDIPIIAMTADVFREDIEIYLNAGMNDHIGKPVDVNELLGKINRYPGKCR